MKVMSHLTERKPTTNQTTKPESTALEAAGTEKSCVCIHNHFTDALKLQEVLNLGIHTWQHLAVAGS